eukprot:scaffold2113_cov233-Pinguiococcus_pyrenoidosus.AAC.16
MSCATMRFSMLRETVSRFGVMASTSSRKMSDGAASSAAENISRRRCSLSPDMPLTISGADTLK